MKNNVLKVQGGNVLLNGVVVNKITDFQIGTASEVGTAECCLTFDIPVRNMEFSNVVFSEAGEKISCSIKKEEILEDFSTEELVRELEKRGAANIYRTDDRNLFVFTGNFCTD